jgi:transcriptional regulator GlxA family with amidase domain
MQSRQLCEDDGAVAPVVEHPRTSGGLAPEKLKRVLEYLRRELASDVRLSVVAQLAGLSLSQFTRAFRASTGVSPYRWLLDERVKRAQVSLAQSASSIAQIAVDVGFADQSHFTKAFRRATGTTPGAWRRQLTSPSRSTFPSNLFGHGPIHTSTTHAAKRAGHS